MNCPTCTRPPSKVKIVGGKIKRTYEGSLDRATSFRRTGGGMRMGAAPVAQDAAMVAPSGSAANEHLVAAGSVDQAVVDGR